MSNSQFYGRFDDSTSKKPETTRENSNSLGYSIAKVFGYMFLWLLITTVVTLGVAFLFSILFKNAGSDSAKGSVLTGGIITVVIAGIALLVTQIVLHVVLFKGRHKILVPAIIYCTLLGVVLGFVSFIIDRAYVNGWPIIAMSFGVTTLTFGVMALIGLTAKSKLNFLGILGFGLLIGLSLMSITMIIFLIFFPKLFIWWYWIIMFGTFLAVMLITIWDIRNVKTYAENGALSDNLSMYLGFNLYSDFIYIFIRILYFVLLIFGKSRN